AWRRRGGHPACPPRADDEAAPRPRRLHLPRRQDQRGQGRAARQVTAALSRMPLSAFRSVGVTVIPELRVSAISGTQGGFLALGPALELTPEAGMTTLPAQSFGMVAMCSGAQPLTAARRGRGGSRSGR